MDESRVYMVFRYSYIIKRLFIAKSIISNFAFHKYCFEKPVVDNFIDLGQNNICKFIKRWNLVKRLKINPNLLFSENTEMMTHYRKKVMIDQVPNSQNNKKDFKVEKVTYLFMDMYSEMDNIIVNVLELASYSNI